MRRRERWTNRALSTLFVIVVGSGVLAFGVGTEPFAEVVVAVHGAAGLGLLVLAPAKSRIVRRGWRRPGVGRRAASALLAVATLVAVGSGLLHAFGGFEPFAGLLPMQLHVGAAVVAAVLIVAHAYTHRERSPLLPRRPELGRRRLLGVGGRAAAVAVAGAAAWAGTAVAAPRRATGSHEVGTDDPAAMPVTQWLFDPVPRLDPATWRLALPGRSVDLAALGVLGDGRADGGGPGRVGPLPRRAERAVLDCTGGWYAEQEWAGVGLDVLLGPVPDGSSVEVVSATGYRRRFPADAAGRLLLATHAAGRALSAGHGGPVRLVVPGRRGFWWVKWVVAVRVVDEPWWWQPPFPLQ